jgi:type IV pilus assembly protein PilQ
MGHSNLAETMKVTFKAAIALLVLIVGVKAQNQLPKDYQSPDEIITLSADMTFEEAFEILSKVAYKAEGKTIIDPLKRQGRIDVQIVNLPWKKAFEIILKAHRLSYKEHEKFYEVVGEAEQIRPGEMLPSLSTREVRIEAIFFEANRQRLAEAGIDWSFLYSSNTLSSSFGVDGATGVSDEIVEGNLNYSTLQDGTEYTISSVLRAFESRNLGRILAQPEIVVTSGKEGRIQVGQDFSIKTRDFAGNVIDNFFSTGTILKVTPVVYTEDGIQFIHLTIHAERSSAQPDVVSTTINKSEAETEVLLVNGETTMVGGLFSREYSTVRKGVPYLKDLPWWFFGFRYIFGQNLKNVSDKELIVVLRASLLPDLRTRAAQPRLDVGKRFEKNRQDELKKLDRHWEDGVESKENLD